MPQDSRLLPLPVSLIGMRHSVTLIWKRHSVSPHHMYPSCRRTLEASPSKVTIYDPILEKPLGFLAIEFTTRCLKYDVTT